MTADAGQQHQRLRVTIQRPAARCYARFCDVERTTEWMPGVRSARVRHYDDGGRPQVVDFMAGPERGGYVYAISYDYEPHAFRVTWTSEGPRGTRRMIGGVRFELVSGETCHMIYENHIVVDAGLPDWAREAQLDRPIEELCQAFKSWVEK